MRGHFALLYAQDKFEQEQFMKNVLFIVLQ